MIQPFAPENTLAADRYRREQVRAGVAAGRSARRARRAGDGGVVGPAVRPTAGRTGLGRCGDACSAPRPSAAG